MTSLRRQLVASFAFVFAMVTAGVPALSTLHVLEHVEQVASSEADGTPLNAPETGASCEECRMLSPSRDIVLPVGPLLPDNASISASVERCAPFNVYARVPYAPASPRAPPIG